MKTKCKIPYKVSYISGAGNYYTRIVTATSTEGAMDQIPGFFRILAVRVYNPCDEVSRMRADLGLYP